MVEPTDRAPSGIARDQPFRRRLSTFEYDHDQSTTTTAGLFRGLRRGFGFALLIFLVLTGLFVMGDMDTELVSGLALLCAVALLISEVCRWLWTRSNP